MHLVRYRVPEEHYTLTVRGEQELEGSVHHPELKEFTGLVTQSHEDGSADLVIFPPQRNAVHLQRVKQGDGPGTFTVTSGGGAAKDW